MSPVDDAAAEVGARRIQETFDAHFKSFVALSHDAATRFAQRDWLGLQSQTEKRLDLYGTAIDALAESFAGQSTRPDRHTWNRMRAIYAVSAAAGPNAELARTFFNSVTRRQFGTTGVDSQTEFIEEVSAAPELVAESIVRRHDAGDGMRGVLRSILTTHDPGAPFARPGGDAELAAHKAKAWLRNHAAGATPEYAETLTPLFYRNKGAYIVGRLKIHSGWVPLVLALDNTERGIAVDALLMDQNDISILFSFARSYFHVASDRSRDLIAFLHSIMPLKPVAELYTSLGFHKHGKTELFRGLAAYLERSADRFESAAVDKGMVMLVFGLPGLDLVFKIIRDRFAYPKKVTRRDVLRSYELVFRHDRVGRLVDAQQFAQLRFKRDRFEPELLEELLLAAPSTVQEDGDWILLRHLYTERRLTPLNLYLRQVDRNLARAALLDYGNAIKELAAANIFPGDFLLKNFGVTRHGRVVFYDYDEICKLSDCRFRELPASRRYEDELAAEPWFSVRDNDVFPQEFDRFLGLPAGLRSTFATHHGDLFTVRFWHTMQERHARGDIVDIFPYPTRQRLRPQGL